MPPDDALLRRLLDELEQTNRDIEHLKKELERARDEKDNLAWRVQQVDINVSRLDRVEEGLGKLQRRIEGPEGLSDRVAILMASASRWDDKKDEHSGEIPSKGQIAALVTLAATALTLLVEMIRELFSRGGGGP